MEWSEALRREPLSQRAKAVAIPAIRLLIAGIATLLGSVLPGRHASDHGHRGKSIWFKN